jgi:hypothetical protein
MGPTRSPFSPGRPTRAPPLFPPRMRCRAVPVARRPLVARLAGRHPPSSSHHVIVAIILLLYLLGHQLRISPDEESLYTEILS